MFANLDRDAFIVLLDKLGSPNDADALSAARDLHAKITVAGASWDELLVPENTAEATSVADDEGVLVAPDADHGAVSDAEKAEARTLIDAIGAREISEPTREELGAYSADLLEGRFEMMDLRYLRALYKRLNAGA
jgi:hypothetical protein